MNDDWRVILPEETRYIRHVEAIVVKMLTVMGFQEIMLPRLISESAWRSVVNEVGEAFIDFEKEVFKVEGGYSNSLVLCHWQCEPYYLALAEYGSLLPQRCFDRSGWSFRDEGNRHSLRARQFQRLEIVWRGTEMEVENLGALLLERMRGVILELGLACAIAVQDDEIAASRQKSVVDLVVTSSTGEEVEVAGMHMHGVIFSERFLGKGCGIETGCFGISLSRLGQLLCGRRGVLLSNPRVSE